ncbi:MAG: spore coat protein [Bacillota bacterium]
MFSDRDMALDCMESTKHSIVELTKAAMESSNPSLKNTLIQMRNRCEQTLQEIGTISMNKGWYMPSPPADHSDIQKVQSFFNRQQMPGQYMMPQHMQQQQFNPMRHDPMRHDPMRYQ